MSRDEIRGAFERATDDLDEVDFADSAWAEGRGMRRRRLLLTGAGLATAGVAAGALVVALWGGGPLDRPESGPAETPALDVAVTASPEPTGSTAGPDDDLATVSAEPTPPSEGGDAAATAAGGESSDGEGAAEQGAGGSTTGAGEEAGQQAGAGGPHTLAGLSLPAAEEDVLAALGELLGEPDASSRQDEEDLSCYVADGQETSTRPDGWEGVVFHSWDGVLSISGPVLDGQTWIDQVSYSNPVEGVDPPYGLSLGMGLQEVQERMPGAVWLDDVERAEPFTSPPHALYLDRVTVGFQDDEGGERDAVQWLNLGPLLCEDPPAPQLGHITLGVGELQGVALPAPASAVVPQLVAARGEPYLVRDQGLECNPTPGAEGTRVQAWEDLSIRGPVIDGEMMVDTVSISGDREITGPEGLAYGMTLEQARAALPGAAESESEMGTRLERDGILVEFQLDDNAGYERVWMITWSAQECQE